MRSAILAIVSLGGLAGAFFASTDAAAALEPASATNKEILLADTSAVFVGTVVGTGSVGKGDYYQYGLLNIRADEIVGSNKLSLNVGQIVSIEVRVLNAVSDDRNRGVRITPELAELTQGDIRFEFQSQELTQGELGAATVGKKFFFVLRARPDLDSHKPLAAMWPLWSGDWIKSCWTGGPCASAPPWHGPMGLETSQCAARVLARQPNLSDVHAGYAPYLKFRFVGANKVPQRALIAVKWSDSGQHLMGAPMLLLAEAPVLHTAPILDKNGAIVADQDRDDNPLKAAIPALAKECNIIYAGNGAHPR